MRVLVGNNKLAKPGGSETYTYAIVEELVKRGHEVFCVAGGGEGLVSKQIEQLGVPVYFHTPPPYEFDVALLSHRTSIQKVASVKTFKIQTCHGVFHPLEQPVPGMDAYVSISEEVKRHLHGLGYDSVLIRNGVNTHRYAPITFDLHENLTVVLSLVHSDRANKIVAEACRPFHCDVIVQNKYKEPIWEIENLINHADLVIGLGRGIYETMACGRNAVIFDYRPYMGAHPIGDGFVTPENLPLFIRYNCSGRYSGENYNAEKLHRELQKYDSSLGDWLRDAAFAYFDIEEKVTQYLELVQ